MKKGILRLKFFMAVGFTLGIVFWGTIIYIAYHFITKYW
jgi:hypothetical protein